MFNGAKGLRDRVFLQVRMVVQVTPGTYGFGTQGSSGGALGQGGTVVVQVEHREQVHLQWEEVVWRKYWFSDGVMEEMDASKMVVNQE
jgi:hypothetical protein